MENNGFKFTYNAKEQDEVKNIRERYMPKEDNKMERLRRLDRSVTEKGTVVSLLVGILGALIMGIGMSLIMTDIGSKIGLENSMVLGIILGIIGMAVAIAAYPLYNYITEKQRKLVTPEILRLTEELLKE